MRHEKKGMRRVRNPGVLGSFGRRVTTCHVVRRWKPEQIDWNELLAAKPENVAHEAVDAVGSLESL
jgi:hypothetical protein